MIKNFTIIVLLLLSGVCGCSNGSKLSGLVPANGELQVNGKVMAGATISFNPVNESRAASAITDANGKFKAMTLNPADGIYPGEYVITVTKIEERGEIKEIAVKDEKERNDQNIEDTREIIEHIPQKYVARDTSDLKITIPNEGDKNITLNLTGEVDLTPKKVKDLKKQ
ncbi:MAG: carboxypeptidase-like regulatory domain-containing protein [Planctomycetaceae bacterium]|jgi:hypothetical protein|nr:carboxypeptidase-like regulatory domain-containing protein [Planctomycetaceae bacterium]